MGTILRAFDIKYMPRTVIKGQVLTDLVAEFTKHPEAGITKEGNREGCRSQWLQSMNVHHGSFMLTGRLTERGLK